MKDNREISATVSDCLQYLDMAGWLELIDHRWRRQVEKDLRIEFGNTLSEDTLKEAVSVVLSPDIELPEEEYEFLNWDDGYYREYIEQRKIETGWNQRHRSE